MEGPLSLVAGVAIEVRDAEEARGFYEPIFGARGAWEPRGDAVIFRTAEQSVELVVNTSPRTLPDSGQHQAYGVDAAMLPGLLAQLQRSGCVSEWWREDHPMERAPCTYVLDPSGNRVQLVASSDAGLLIDHVALNVHDMPHARSFYTQVLGGMVDYAHGRDMDHYAEAKAYLEGDDPCAPWTRYVVESRSHGRPGTTFKPVSRPAMQLFLGIGPTRLGLMLGEHDYQEPPEEHVRGTPCVTLRSAAGFGPTLSRLSASAPTFVQEYPSLFLRDPSGNFLEIAC